MRQNGTKLTTPLNETLPRHALLYEELVSIKSGDSRQENALAGTGAMSPTGSGPASKLRQFCDEKIQRCEDRLRHIKSAGHGMESFKPVFRQYFFTAFLSAGHGVAGDGGWAASISSEDDAADSIANNDDEDDYDYDWML